ncbi:MAG: transcriptional regulator [Candidatus Thiodiazotropha taylori]|nr:transcriptional regulator [Candidatus Thiodiazotropha taylori]MCG8083830.1 transcriptional regulator [Candidatus Thiodiazotropha taylori]
MQTAAISTSVNESVLESILSAWQRRAGLITTLGFTLFSLLLLYMAWLNHSQAVWTAEAGWGYWLGIVGGSMMLLLLLYPMRKRLHFMSKWLTVKFWFRLHMVFGVLGPVLIMMHSSYHIGSLNGQVALYSMLFVAISGLFGRYFYTRIHYGLYGKKATFASLHADSLVLTKKLGRLFELNPKAKELMKQYEKDVMNAPTGPIASAKHWIKMRYTSAVLYPKVMRSLNKKLLAVGYKKGWSKSKVRRNQLRIRKMLLSHRSILRQILELHFYERLFAIWHLLHMPLFIMMVITGFVHVYAVHAY